MCHLLKRAGEVIQAGRPELALYWSARFVGRCNIQLLGGMTVVGKNRQVFST